MSDDRPAGDASSRYDQARYVENGEYEPLLSEKDLTRVEVGGDGNASGGEDGSPLPDDLTRDSLELPALSEPELARHYTRLSQMIYGIDSGPYPLGSCTMKYNPKFTEDVAALPAAAVHPDRSEESVQGTLELLYRLQDYLGRIGGMDAVTLQPPAGAAGEFVGIRVAAAYHEHNGEGHRDEVIVPESAHGTNFATAALGGYDVVSLPSDDEGRVDLDALEAALSENTAALMLTNPNTLGLFERDIAEIAELVHEVGGLLYYDGANLNALLGRARPGDMGFDVMHYNVHKTFATPHGGGGPGAGPVGVVDDLAPFLPAPRIRKRDERSKTGEPIYERFDPERTIGKVHGFEGNWLVLVKTFAYIARLGDEGLADASASAVLNANYLAERIDYEVPYGPFHHEFVASAGEQDAADVAKRMLDYGVHPPTTKWPEIVPEALMTEPTEVESKTTLDRLAAAFNAVAGEDDAALETAPERTTARRIDQTSAARNPRLSWQALEDES
ncbi:aminomethyl-transferring glycine dehydrogenase subunit GcvPB [Natrinema salaciae]|uniref:glycine dehydrogenase (aminomethyl-transferring) n=1 Tax=Natrinema salaciae TaxID=1186196 RepID=A0A1H9B6H1_9EURY|nr:aminomethyl-transferring glycine dehydrogenase subunit GcvPB [Natrinema salaciae]SEP84455.1 glycine dehydrogenase (decarboxylating) beta subunit [Natrinema salaciae]